MNVTNQIIKDSSEHTSERSLFAQVVFDLAKASKELKIPQDQLTELYLSIKKLLSSLSTMKNRLSVVFNFNQSQLEFYNDLVPSPSKQTVSPASASPSHTPPKEVLLFITFFKFPI